MTQDQTTIPFAPERHQPEARASVGIAQKGLFRLLLNSDRAALKDHLLRLDSKGRMQRFSMNCDNRFISEYADRCFANAGLLCGFFIDDTLRGIGELRRLGMGGMRGGDAEACLSIEPAWQNRGFGKLLLDRLIQFAGTRRIDTLHFSFLANNEAMNALMLKSHAQMTFEACDAAAIAVASLARGSVPPRPTCGFVLARLDLHQPQLDIQDQMLDQVIDRARPLHA